MNLEYAWLLPIAVAATLVATPTIAAARAHAPAAAYDASNQRLERTAIPVVVGGLYSVIKGIQACRKLEKNPLLRPIAKACKDFYERKFIKLVAKIVGVKTATAMLTCSETLPKKTHPVVRSLAKMVCG